MIFLIKGKDMRAEIETAGDHSFGITQKFYSANEKCYKDQEQIPEIQ